MKNRLIRDNYSLGLNLVELLVAIAIIMVLAAIAVPVISRVIETSHIGTCANNLRQIGLAASLYSADHAGKFPQPWEPGSIVWNERLSPYLAIEPSSVDGRARFFRSKVWFCPSAELINNNYDNRHYGMNDYLRRTPWNLDMMAPPNPTEIVIVGEKNSNTEYINPNSAMVEYTGDALAQYRMSHRGRGANYLFADNHVEFRVGLQPNNNAEDSIWRWW